MKNQSKIIILFGRSGCGKGTQAKLLQQEFGFDYIGSGDILRERAKKSDFSGQKLKAILERGDRSPTFLTFQLWSKKIENFKDQKEFKGLVVDGSPRTAIEAQLMDQVFGWFEWQDVKILLLDISEQEAFNRLTKRRICKKCGQLIPWIGDYKNLEKCDKCSGDLIVRPDDSDSGVKARMEYFKKDVQPAIDFYEKEGKLIRINGQQAIEDVCRDIKKVIARP